MSVVTVCVKVDLPSLNLLLGWTCGNYVEVDNPGKAKFCMKINVNVKLLKKGGYRTSRLRWLLS